MKQSSLRIAEEPIIEGLDENNESRATNSNLDSKQRSPEDR
jgi:hypothetical protein